MENSVEQVKLSKLFKDFISGVADWLNRHWVAKIIIQALPIIWSSVIMQLCKTVLYDESGNPTTICIICVICLGVLSILVLLITSVKGQSDRTNLGAAKSELKLRQTITGAECTLEDARNLSVRDWIAKANPTQELLTALRSVRDPRNRIISAMEGLRDCLQQISDIPKADIHVTAAVAVMNGANKKYVKGGEWQWIALPSSDGMVELKDLLNNPSSFKLVVEGKQFFYANDKSVAAENHEYYLDRRDEMVNKVGSIICYEVTERIKNQPIRMIISISTYGKRIVETQSRNAEDIIKICYEDRIRRILLRQFEGGFKEDLLWYWLQKQNSRNK